MKKSAIVFIILLSIILVRCEKEKSGLISKNQEISFGEQLDSLVMNSPEDYNVIDESEYYDAYAYAIHKIGVIH